MKTLADRGFFGTKRWDSRPLYISLTYFSWTDKSANCIDPVLLCSAMKSSTSSFVSKYSVTRFPVSDSAAEPERASS
jgi:hypothetical protein